jgi:ribosomal protein S12 methylthiotransferase accessory factor
MEKLNRTKPYKALDPITTINWIRQILGQYGAFTIEKHYENNIYEFCSCRIEIANDGFSGFHIGTNGKGMSIPYSLASAYGEFMERLQNGALFNNFYATKYFVELLEEENLYKKKIKENDLLLKYQYAPDEIVVKIDELINSQLNFLAVLFSETNKKQIYKYLNTLYPNGDLICLPYYNVSKKTIDYLPYDLMKKFFGTNGFCAGNTSREALIQGICEIIERYAIKCIYKNELTLPTIDHDFFYGTIIYERIKLIEQNENKKIVIKNCSMGLGLPVVGVIIIDLDENKYTFLLGSDVSYITALERCFTEIYQGIESIRYKTNHFCHNPFESIDVNEYVKIKQKNYLKTIKCGTGFWPLSIFQEDENYFTIDSEFKNTESDEKDLKKIIDKILTLGFDIYIRDVSYLGFPSYHIFIPRMSEIFYVFDQKEMLIKNNLDKAGIILLNIKNTNDCDLKNLASTIDESLQYEFFRDFDIKNYLLYNTSHDINNLDHDLLLFMIWLKLNDFVKALKYLNNYLNKKESSQELQYYQCFKDYLKMYINNIDEEKKTTLLSVYYYEHIVKQVQKDFINRKDIFSNFKLSSCFNCNNCDIAMDCKYFDILKQFKKIHDKKNSKIIHQYELETILTESVI